MIFRIRHRTIYRFSREVFLEPHTVRLRPRCDPFQKLLDYSLTVDPAAAGRSEGSDAEGNPATVLWFNGTTRDLDILSEATVQTLRPDPFDYFLTSPETMKLPAVYPAIEEAVLEPYRRRQGERLVMDLAEALAAETQRDTLAFLSELNSKIYREWDVVVREEGAPFEPKDILQRKEASCRDLTALFMAVSREVGLACRFVSGYQEGDPVQTRRYLHAWPEIYLPGAGWKGYDPTLGLVVADRHVALAAGATPISAAPTQGTFRGTEATASMEIELSIATETEKTDAG